MNEKAVPLSKVLILIGLIIFLLGANAAAIQQVAHWMGWAPSVLPVPEKLFVLIAVPFMLVELALLSLWFDIGLDLEKDKQNEAALNSGAELGRGSREKPGEYEDRLLSQYLVFAVFCWIGVVLLAGSIGFFLINDPEMLKSQPISVRVVAFLRMRVNRCGRIWRHLLCAAPFALDRLRVGPRNYKASKDRIAWR